MNRPISESITFRPLKAYLRAYIKKNKDSLVTFKQILQVAYTRNSSKVRRNRAQIELSRKTRARTQFIGRNEALPPKWHTNSTDKLLASRS